MEIGLPLIQCDTVSHPIESNTFEYNHRICAGKCVVCGVTGCGSRMENHHKNTLKYVKTHLISITNETAKCAKIHGPSAQCTGRVS